MTYRRASLLLFRLCAAIVLAIVGLQAAEPIHAPLERVSGSAFSAGTSDVALVSARRIEAPADFDDPAPPLPLPVIATDPIRPVLPLVSARWETPRSRAPPPRARPERRPDTRAPPFA